MLIGLFSILAKSSGFVNIYIYFFYLTKFRRLGKAKLTYTCSIYEEHASDALSDDVCRSRINTM